MSPFFLNCVHLAVAVPELHTTSYFRLASTLLSFQPAFGFRQDHVRPIASIDAALTGCRGQVILLGRVNLRNLSVLNSKQGLLAALKRARLDFAVHTTVSDGCVGRNRSYMAHGILDGHEYSCCALQPAATMSPAYLCQEHRWGAASPSTRESLTSTLAAGISTVDRLEMTPTTPAFPESANAVEISFDPTCVLPPQIREVLRRNFCSSDSSKLERYFTADMRIGEILDLVETATLLGLKGYVASTRRCSFGLVPDYTWIWRFSDDRCYMPVVGFLPSDQSNAVPMDQSFVLE